MFGNPLMKSKFAFGLPSNWPDNIHVDLHSDPNRCEPYDVQQPTFRAKDASARESNNGSDSSMTFTVILQYSGGGTHTVEYHTQDGTADGWQRLHGNQRDPHFRAWGLLEGSERDGQG